MKTTKFTSASRLAFLAIAIYATLSFTSCNKEEPSIDELLSEQTTPVTFTPLHGKNYVFDYAGSHLVSSDTISAGWDSEISLDLRQGKHRLLWFRELDGNNDLNFRDGQYISGVHFDPQKMEITSYNTNCTCGDLSYASTEVNVTEYLLPTRKLTYQSLTSDIVFDIIDSSPLVPTDFQIGYSWAKIGTVSGFPAVRSISLEGKNYIKSETFSKDVYSHDCSYDKDLALRPGDLPAIGVGLWVQNILCPLNGLDDIQLTAEVHDRDGNHIPTTPLPKFSIRRGFTTRLRGPLFSGSTSDWEVKMEPLGIE